MSEPRPCGHRKTVFRCVTCQQVDVDMIASLRAERDQLQADKEELVAGCEIGRQYITGCATVALTDLVKEDLASMLVLLAKHQPKDGKS